MDAALLWVNIGLLVAGAGAAAIAWWQAIEASRERKKADESARRALAAQESAASALERAAAAQEAIAAASRPHAWGVPKRTTGDGWVIRNSSGQQVEVRGVDVEPAQFSNLLHVDVPKIVDSGDFLSFVAHRRMGAEIRTFAIRWRFVEGGGEEHRSVRTLS